MRKGRICRNSWMDQQGQPRVMPSLAGMAHAGLLVCLLSSVSQLWKICLPRIEPDYETCDFVHFYTLTQLLFKIRFGERLVAHHLRSVYGSHLVTWENEESEKGKPYDLRLEDSDGVEHWIEVRDVLTSQPRCKD